jgi:hypothetical protein|tara:strand:- start:1890 stop:3341 length:1452 start_codon:yes stop_codon:yes gene_type:complete
MMQLQGLHNKYLKHREEKMSKSLYDEAIAEAKVLRAAAEQNAKNAIIEAVTPRIRNFIEEQLVGDISDPEHDESDVLESVISEEALEQALSDSELDENIDESVELDESALHALIELIGGEDVSSALSGDSTKNVLDTAISESFNSLDPEDRQKLLKIAHKFNEGAEFFDSAVIDIDDDLQTENQSMSGNDEILYEIDLNELEEDTHPAKIEQKVSPASEIADEERYLNELMLQLDLGDVELPDDLRDALSTASLSVVEPDEEEADLDVEEEPVEEPEGEMAMPEIPGLEEEEMYEIDENMLRKELSNLREQLSEGEAKAMAHHFGGGKAGKDALAFKDTDINVLKEMRRLKRNLNTSGRKNRALQNKLNEYRSAVETLREQLTDLNLFNSKLLYVNKLLQNKNVSATQRKSIIESLDSARSLREVKLLYKSLIESFSKDKPKNLSESAVRRTLGSSSRATRRASAQTSEAAEVNRWAELAGLK